MRVRACLICTDPVWVSHFLLTRSAKSGSVCLFGVILLTRSAGFPLLGQPKNSMGPGQPDFVKGNGLGQPKWSRSACLFPWSGFVSVSHLPNQPLTHSATIKRPLNLCSEFDQFSKTFKGLSGPLPSNVASEMNNVLNRLTGTKESIKGSKMWFMHRSPFATVLAEALRDRVFSLDDSKRQLRIIYLANDILFDSLQRRLNPHEINIEALAIRHVLGYMLARIYHNPLNKGENQSRLQKILEFWASKEVYDS